MLLYFFLEVLEEERVDLRTGCVEKQILERREVLDFLGENVAREEQDQEDDEDAVDLRTCQEEELNPNGDAADNVAAVDDGEEEEMMKDWSLLCDQDSSWKKRLRECCHKEELVLFLLMKKMEKTRMMNVGRIWCSGRVLGEAVEEKWERI